LRVVHTSDTHLGHQQYGRIDAEGLNQREQDGYAAWHAIVDHAVRTRADLFLHAGDLFDGVRPSNRALGHALDGFLKLSRAGIPAIVIAGNHEHPKLRETGSPLRLFGHLAGIHPVYKGQVETIRLDLGGDDPKGALIPGSPTRPATPHLDGPPSRERRTVTVHAVPQVADHEELARQVSEIQRGPGINILVVHGAVSSLKAFSHAEFNELTLDTSWFDDRFDYVALGHYHGVQQVGAHAWYCGAPERVSMSESGQEKGFLDVGFEGPADGVVAHARFHPLPVRPYADLPIVDATGLGNDEIVAAAKAALARVPATAVARLRIHGIDPALRTGLDVRAIQAAGRHALHLDLRTEWADAVRGAQGSAEFAPLVEEFEAYAAKVPLEGVDRQRLLAMARQVLGGAA
jgi:exonuclease SbcD